MIQTRILTPERFYREQKRQEQAQLKEAEKKKIEAHEKKVEATRGHALPFLERLRTVK